MKINPINPPMGKYRSVFSVNSVILIFNIITTNRNNTAIAPIYTTRNSIAKKSSPNSNSSPDALTNTRIKNRTEYTGFLELITMVLHTSARLENKKKSTCSTDIYKFLLNISLKGTLIKYKNLVLAFLSSKRLELDKLPRIR